jgi:hypothetical protein
MLYRGWRSCSGRAARRLVGFGVFGSALAAPLLGACPSVVTGLEPGTQVTVPATAASCPHGPRYVLDVPDGILRLEVRLRAGRGNADLLLRRGTFDSPSALYSSSGPTNDETVVADDPAPGQWSLEVPSVVDAIDARLLAVVTAEETFVAPGLGPRGLAAIDPERPRLRFFTLEVPAGSERLTVTTRGGSGDVDLYVRPGALPSETTYAAASKHGGNDEGVDIPTPATGTWKVGLLRVSPYEGVDLDIVIDSGGACGEDANTLCLLGGRFQARVSWRIPAASSTAEPQTGPGVAIRDTDQTGAFYFFSRDNTELFVKLLDGRGINGAYWVFWGGLTNLEYDLEVVDTATGEVRSYHHPAGGFAGGADTSAFLEP